MAASAESFVTLPDASRICYQTFGSPNGTPILLISGGGQSMLSWPEGFITQLLNSNSSKYYIIRYDLRDVGRSTHFALKPEGQRSYTLYDLCNDALALLDHLNLPSAHVMGFSLGGGIAWCIAARFPERVRSLVLISSSPVGPATGPQDDIPRLDTELGKQLSDIPMPIDWHDQSQAVRFLTMFDSMFIPRPVTPNTQCKMTETATRIFKRAEQDGGQVNSFFNHNDAAWTRWPREELAAVTCSTLIVHGKLDKVLPLRHGEVLAEEIKDARMLIIDDMGHEFPSFVWSAVIEFIHSVAG